MREVRECVRYAMLLVFGHGREIYKCFGGSGVATDVREQWYARERWYWIYLGG